MAKTTAWQSQTKWLSDQTYYSEKPGIWTDRVTKWDKHPQVSDRDLARRKGVDKRVLAVAIVDKTMRMMGAKAQAVTPRQKWLAVELLEQKRGMEAFAVLTA